MKRPLAHAAALLLAIGAAIPLHAQLPATQAAAHATAARQAGGRQMSVADLRAWKSIRGEEVSNDGKWLGYQLVPNEGDATAVFRATSGTTERRFPMGEVNAPNGPTGTLDISGDSRWALFTVAPLRRDAEKARLAHRPIETKAALVNLATGEKKEFDRVRRFAFLGDHPRWVALSAYPQDAGAAAPAAAPAPAGGRGGANAAPARVEASDLLLYNLDSGELVNIGNVGEFAVDDAGQYLAYTIETRDRMGDGVQLRDLKSDVVRALESDRAIYRHLAWADSGLALAVVKLAVDSAARDTAVSVVAFTGFGANGPKKTVLAGTGRSDIASGLAISPDRAPKWSRDLATVYVGLRHAPRPAPRGPEQGNNLQSLVRPGAPGMGGTMNMPQTGAPTDEDLPSLILWHWKDPRLQSQQIVEEARDKRYSYLAAYRVADDKVTRLADDSVREVTVAPGDRYAYALDEQPYLNQASSTGRAFVDIYTIDVRTGARSKRVSKVITRASASPDGRHLMYWGMDAQWHVIDMATGDERSMTKDLPVTFANVEDDHYNLVQPPEPVVGWSKDGAWALLSDGWDVWKVSVSGAPAVNLTGNGRRDKVRYQRRVFVDPKEQGIDLRKPLFFQIYGEWTKKAGLARVDAMKGGATRLMWDDAAFNFVRAKDADAVLYSRSTFVDFPDWYIARADYSGGTRLTDANPQQKDFAWSSGARLVNYVSDKGDTLQGALFLPANYEPGKKYPMIVEIYEKLSQGLHGYVVPNDTRAPNISVYTSRGYAVLEPDIVYRVNDPGMSAVWCVVPAVKAAIATGIVDSAHVGLHGHSWGGYQTSFLVTQTHIFAAAIAGAPLTDMISMDGSIYWNTGTADAAIFESSQGRFKGGFLDNWDAYVRNTPAFHSKNVTTPLIILSDDKDGAVDFNQGVTWFNHLRGAGKNVILLTYVGENHGLAKPVNQRDYAARMGEFFDHYLKGAPAPEWMTDGIPRLQMEDRLKARRARVQAELNRGSEP